MRKMLLAAAALAVALAASAQEPKFDFRRDSTRTSGFTLPDSLAHMSPWKPDYKTMAPVRTKPTVSMTSVVDPEGEPPLAHHRHRQQYAASGSAFQPLERSGLELESFPRRIPRRTYAFVPHAAVTLCRDSPSL